MIAQIDFQDTIKYYVHGIDETYCLELGVGSHLVGRCSEAVLQLNDPSVSSRHAELELTGEGTASVRDLGSTNGTFIGNEKIQSASVSLGEIVTFGNVRLKLDTEAANVFVPTVDNSVQQPQPSWMPDGEPACLFHPGIYADFRCNKCGHCLCPDCIRQVGLKGRRPTYFCLSCSGKALRLQNRAKRSRMKQVFQKVGDFFRD